MTPLGSSSGPSLPTLPPGFVDALVHRATMHDDALIDALQDAATYRALFHMTLQWWYDERQYRLRADKRLKVLMGLEPEHDA